jgi:hypothetical protein
MANTPGLIISENDLQVTIFATEHACCAIYKEKKASFSL